MYEYINLNYLNTVSAGDKAVKKQIIELFFTQMDEISGKLQEALDKKDYKELSQTAHLAKSSLRIMGIDDIAQQMEVLQETASEESEVHRYPELVKYFLKNIPFAVKELQEELSKNG
ncbi:MAG: Hpt domain-containing protein [Bacteroidales bacterium]|nr:Hpt domain-containing protein [Bacteroidales bacterium]